MDVSGFAVRSVVDSRMRALLDVMATLYHFMLAWIVLFDPPLYMGMAMLRATCKVYRHIISARQCISWHGNISWHVEWEISWHGQGHKSSSPLSRSLYQQCWGACYVSHLYLGLTAPVLEPSRAFHCLD